MTLEKLPPLAYRELHRLAQHYMRGESPGRTLQATALVNEAYVRLIDTDRGKNLCLHLRGGA
jgi:hypothetical protein